MMRKILTAVLLTVLLCSSQAFAEYDSFKLGQAVGGYISTVDLFEQLSESQCGYIVRKKYSVKDAIRESVKYFNDQDKKEFQDFAESSLKRMQAENAQFITKYMQAGKRDGMDEKTLCGMLMGLVAPVSESAKQKWETTRDLYSN